MTTDYSFFLPGSQQKGIILVHGLTGSPAEMKFVGKHLHKQGLTVYAPTLAGHCADDARLLATRCEDWVQSIKDAITKMRDEVAEIYLAGICVGGQVALLAAQQNPDKVKGVVIYSATLNYDGWNTPFYYPWSRYIMPLLVRIPAMRRVNFAETPPYGIKSDRVRNAVMRGGDGIEGTLPHFPAMALYENHRLNKQLAKVLPQTNIPTLLIHAREDDVSHPRNAEEICRLHGGACKIEWLDDSYHLVHVDQERKKTAALTAQFCGITPLADAA